MKTSIEHQSTPSNHSALSRQILVYLALVFSFSSVPYSLIIHDGHLAMGNGMMVFLLMWCPALATFAACSIFRIDVSTLGWHWRPVRFEIWAYLLPLFYSFPVYIATWVFISGSFALTAFAAQSSLAFGFPQWPRTATWLLTLPCYASVGVLGSMTRALGEEIGWRGFLLPRLVGRAGFTRGCFLSGCIWAVWHYPLLLFADYNSGTPRLYALSCFTVMVIGDAFIFGWFRLKSGSLWPAAMLHASHNLFIQAIFDRITGRVGKSLYITTEFGVGLALTVGVCAFYLWTRRGEVEGSMLHVNANRPISERFESPAVPAGRPHRDLPS